MKERPILFSAPMVRAILDGSKTQTRRVVKPRKDATFGCLLRPNELAGEVNAGNFENSHYGLPGDRLWVRETWQGPLVDDFESFVANPDKFQNPEFCEYAADGRPAPEFITVDDEIVQRWRPSVHMPRWASRILLEVTGVRVEKLRDISESDAKAEGARSADPATGRECILDPSMGSYRLHYRDIWESINGPGSWDVNPRVWVIEFKAIAHVKGQQ